MIYRLNVVPIKIPTEILGIDIDKHWQTLKFIWKGKGNSQKFLKNSRKVRGLPLPYFIYLFFFAGLYEYIFFLFFNLILYFNFAILYWFCHISTWIRHRYTHVPHPEPSSLLPPHTIPLGHPSAPAPSIQYRALNLDWRLVSYMILYMFQCHPPKSSHPLPLPQSPKDCSVHSIHYLILIELTLEQYGGQGCQPYLPLKIHM